MTATDTTGSGGPRRSIELSDVDALGDVNKVLGRFYADAVRDAAGESGASEREIRRWFEDHLITAQGFRAQTLEGPGANGAAVLRALQDKHVIRSDSRRGATWYELAHDRLVDPIRENNREWEQANLSLLQREAKVWFDQNGPDGLLISGEVLREAEAWVAANESALEPFEREYLAACRKAAAEAELKRRSQKRTKRLAILSTAFAVVALVGLVAALVLWQRSVESQEEAEAANEATVDALKSAANVGRKWSNEANRLAGNPSTPPTTFGIPLSIPTDCDKAATVVSSTGGDDLVEPQVLRNDTGGEIVVSWIAPEGERLEWARIAPGEELRLDYLYGWAFVVEDLGGNCLGVWYTPA